MSAPDRPVSLAETASHAESKARPTATAPEPEIRVPVVEVFGPTIQGEGPVAGLSTYFVRVASCDYRCSWCDSPHAVLPELWKDAPRMTAEAIVAEIEQLHEGPDWVTLSGGNPASLRLGPLVRLLHEKGYRVCMETQGSRWQEYMMWIDCLVLSPKPPSSGMVSEHHDKQWSRFKDQCVRARMATIHRTVPSTAVKVVVFNDEDYEWAAKTFSEVKAKWPCYVSVGTLNPNAKLDTATYREQIGESYRKLCEKVAADPRMSEVRVIPQLHVIAYGEMLGV